MTSLSDLHVLIVDDSRQMRHVLRCLLRAVGIYAVSEAETANAALAIMRAGPVDLVLLDWKMAPIDGLSFARIVRWSPTSPNPYVPILMLTAHTEASRVAAARDAGVTGFVKKPISARMLFDRISFALTDTRMFVRTEDFFGPDRRHGAIKGYAGPFRRSTDARTETAETFDVDDLRWSA
ncbi:MAG TPA: response regulator [Vitreimonas sp.]|uniref:response regulator n=1 Tax=Vitreimonas sp. TaxID=3069702 RepID=UPI002D35794E|nr:response regulator [Vitreimonas sp.]HYD88040.1 response regulator [Vitreimonas sp.]